MPKNQIYIISGIAIILIVGAIIALIGNKSNKIETIAIPSNNVQQVSQMAQKQGYKPTLDGLNVEYLQDQTIITYPRKKLDNTKLANEFEQIAKSINLSKVDTSSLLLKAGFNETMDSVDTACTNTDKTSLWCFKLTNSQDGVTTIEINKQIKKELKPVAFGENFTNNGFDLKVEEVKWVDALTSKNPYTLPIKAKNKILAIKISGVNNNKIADSVKLNNIKLTTNKDLEFEQMSGISSFSQIDKTDLPSGFEGCLSCKVNPSDRAKEYIFFDFAEQPLTDLYLVSGDNKVILK
jgi:hypothetical protein